MTYDLSGIMEFLQQAVHPEIHHFRNGSHPGRGWWLKTVCPDPTIPRLDCCEFGRSWQEFAERNPGLVQIVPVAFDWTGTRLADTLSVWLADDRDLAVIQVGNGLIFREIPKTVTDQQAAVALTALAADQQDEAAGQAALALERQHLHADLRSRFALIQNHEDPDDGN